MHFEFVELSNKTPTSSFPKAADLEIGIEFCAAYPRGNRATQIDGKFNGELK